MADGAIDITAKPTEEISVRDVFGIDTDMKVKGFADGSDRVPAIDPTYKFDADTTLAILAGFSGVLLIVRPGPEGFSEGTFFALAAVLCITARDLITRKISPGVPSIVVALSAMIAVFVTAAMLSLGVEWAPLDAASFPLLAGAAVFIFAGFLFSVMAMRVGEIAVISPFRYSGLLWALVLGWLVFGDWPDALTMLGAVIVVATGMFTLYRERAVSAAAKRART